MVKGMAILSPKVHGLLDYGVVIAFAILPAAAGLSGAPKVLSWVLAVVHLGLTLLTDFPLGAVKLVPLRVHGLIELAVVPVLLAAPWLLRFSADPVARSVYLVAGAAIFVTWLLTDYSIPEPSVGAPPVPR